MRLLDHGLLLAAAAIAASGCYESHTLPLDGERWTCRCHWTVQLPAIDFECELPIGGGDPECGIMTGVGTGTLTTHEVFETIHVCTVFADPADDPAFVCNDACSDPQFQPFGTVGSGRDRAPGRPPVADAVSVAVMSNPSFVILEGRDT
jgi:hypothetical protein